MDMTARALLEPLLWSFVNVAIQFDMIEKVGEITNYVQKRLILWQKEDRLKNGNSLDGNTHDAVPTTDVPNTHGHLSFYRH